MYRKFSPAIPVLLMLLLVLFPVYSLGEGIQLELNGMKVPLVDKSNNIQQCIVTEDGTVYLPAEAFIEILGGTCEYDKENRKLIISLAASGENAGQSQPQKERIDITTKNFSNYFAFSWTTFDHEYKQPYVSEKLTLKITAKQPMEIYNVHFKVQPAFMRTMGEGVMQKEFSGTIPQSGSYEYTEEISWQNKFNPNDSITIGGNNMADVLEASGYILVDPQE